MMAISESAASPSSKSKMGSTGDLLKSGLFNFKNGAQYSGQHINYVFHGKGLYRYSNGSSYDGEWLNGLRSGKGTFYFPYELLSD